METPPKTELRLAYVVCKRLLDPETWGHCDFDGELPVDSELSWRCPVCGALRSGVGHWVAPASSSIGHPDA